MRISDWSSDVCSSDLDVQCRGSAAVDGARKGDAAGCLATSVEAARRGTQFQQREPVLASLRGSIDAARPPSDRQYGLVGPDGRLRQHRDVHDLVRSEEHTSELQSLMRNSYAVFCLKKNK